MACDYLLDIGTSRGEKSIGTKPSLIVLDVGDYDTCLVFLDKISENHLLGRNRLPREVLFSKTAINKCKGENNFH